MENFGRGAQATDESVTGRGLFAGLITKATDAHLECVISIALPRQEMVTPPWYDLRILCLGLVRKMYQNIQSVNSAQ